MKTVNGSFAGAVRAKAGVTELVESVLTKTGKQFKDTLRNWDNTNPIDIENFAENLSESVMANTGYPNKIGFTIEGTVVTLGYVDGNKATRFGKGGMFTGPTLVVIDTTDALKVSTIHVLEIYGVRKEMIESICDTTGQVCFAK